MFSASLSSRSAASGEPSRMNVDFFSVGEALNLVPPFKGDKQEVLALLENVDSTFAVINPSQAAILNKFVLTRISGDPRTVIGHRNIEIWAKLREFLQNSYIEKRTLDFHASRLLKARQGKDEKVADWIHKVQKLGSQFRKAAKKGRERAYWICRTGYATFALFIDWPSVGFRRECEVVIIKISTR